MKRRLALIIAGFLIAVSGSAPIAHAQIITVNGGVQFGPMNPIFHPMPFYQPNYFFPPTPPVFIPHPFMPPPMFIPRPIFPFPMPQMAPGFPFNHYDFAPSVFVSIPFNNIQFNNAPFPPFFFPY
ncbi:MAG: hypothetical protein Q7S01_03430 [bacterium]|nr:hypothetical protein [bacterium]